MPEIEEPRVAPCAQISEIEIACTKPALRVCCARPRLPKRTKIGEATSTMVIFETTMRSRPPPSTISSEMPDWGLRFHKSVRPNIAQLLTVMFLKSPQDSVPNLKQLQAE